MNSNLKLLFHIFVFIMIVQLAVEIIPTLLLLLKLARVSVSSPGTGVYTHVRPVCPEAVVKAADDRVVKASCWRVDSSPLSS